MLIAFPVEVQDGSVLFVTDMCEISEAPAEIFRAYSEIAST